MILLAIGMMLMAGCDETLDSARTETSEPAPTTETSEPVPTASSTRTASTAAPADPMLSCNGGEPVFPRAAIEEGRLSLDELEQRDPGAAMVEFFTSGEGADQLHDLNDFDSFALLSESEREVFVGEFRDGRLDSYVSLEARSGEWEVRTFGDCVARLTGQQGRAHATRWELADVSEGGRQLQLQAEGGMCDDQPETKTRLVDVQVEETPDAVLISVWVHHPDSSQPCDGVGISVPATARLEEPLGQRELLDGGVEPPTHVPQPTR